MTTNSLLDIYNRNTTKYTTDKNTTHSYIEHLYNNILDNTITDLLEIGISDFGGGSALLWKDYFLDAKIDVIDIYPCVNLENQERINFILGNAYSLETLEKLRKYDVIIDDGPHTLDSMIFFVQNYIHLLKPNGIAIIEDIQNYVWFDSLVSLVPSNFTSEIIDLRHIKNRYDDLLLIIKYK